MKLPASLRQSLTLYFIAVAMLPVLLLGMISYLYFKNEHLNTIFSLINLHAENVTREAAEFLSSTSTSLANIEGELRSGFLHNDAEINRYLQLMVDESDSFESIYMLDEDHRITHLGLVGGSLVRLNEYLGLDLSAYQIFNSRNQTAGPFWSDTFISPITVEPSISLAIPVGNGLLLGTVSLRKLSVRLAQHLAHVEQSFHFSLVDHHGVLIADSSPDLISQRLNLNNHAEVRSALDAKVEATSKYHEDGSRLESVRVVPEVGWVAYVSLPVEEAMQSLEPLRLFLFSTLAFAGGLGLILSFWLCRRVLKPILSLRGVAIDVAGGNYSGNLPPSPYQELEDLSGSFRGMIAAVEERERSLSENRARFRDLVNTIEGIVWEFDLGESRFTFVSDQAEHVLGYPPQRWLDEQDFWQQHLHADDRGRVIAFSAAEVQAGRDHDGEFRMIAADDRIVWLRSSVSVISEAGRPVYLRGVMFDISIRKQAEQSLQETTARLQLLINRMPFGCIVWGPERRAELWNPAAERIFGYNSAEVIGRHPFDFLAPEHARQEFSDIMVRLASGDTTAHSIHENLTRDGRTIICEWHNTPLQNTHGVTENIISIVQDITQRVAAETALRESESRFRSVFQTSPDVVLIVRANDRRIIDVNDNCLKTYGYTREEMLEKTTTDLELWADPVDRDNYMEQMRRHGFVENNEVSLRMKSGRVRVGLISSRTLVLNDEDFILTVIRDITEMKDAQTRLVRSESRFHSLIAVMGEGLMILAYNGEIVQCNQTAERILQLESGDIVGKLHNELYQDAIREDGTSFEPGQHPTAITLATGKPVVNQVLGLPRQDGQMTWLQVNTNSLGLDRHGKPVAVVVSFADVTRLMLIERELRESELHMQTLSMQLQGVLEAIPDRIMIIDRNMNVIWINWHHDDGVVAGQRSNENVCCYEMSDVICSPLAGVVTSLCDDCPIKAAFASGRTENVQVELTNRRSYSLRAFPVFNELGEVVNVIQIAQDVTEAIRHQAQALRTGQLAALGELAAGVAHEINNPINGVINYAQLILNKALAGSREEELSQRIIRESDRIATIVRELLIFAREDSQEINCTTVSTSLQEALALIQSQLNKDGIALELQLPADLPRILCRSHQIPQLFLNLISNARHALCEKYPGADPDKTILIRGEAIIREAQPFVRIMFRDHGTGIEPELLPRVMNPFITTKAAGEGTGLGLSISHEIVQKHGGALSIDSVHGEFTEVVVELPAMPEGNPAPEEM